jgi:sulfur-carrier protein
MITITLKCYATLATYCPQEGTVTVPGPMDLTALMARLGVPAEEVKLIFVNGKRVNPDRVLVDGDQVGLFPPVGGG